ncbi:MAG: hypothetical protein KatS3mg038_1955 [Candidatus Kapaibacterium sp.]|nr:MAG: hypothetical protein KatS3mg038_1955 [Candidatus Kapabacteria bacterium]
MKLYPRMRERPPEFRLNPHWPYYGNIVFMLLPMQSFMTPVDSGLEGYKITWDAKGQNPTRWDTDMQRLIWDMSSDWAGTAPVPYRFTVNDAIGYTLMAFASRRVSTSAQIISHFSGTGVHLIINASAYMNVNYSEYWGRALASDTWYHLCRRRRGDEHTLWVNGQRDIVTINTASTRQENKIGIFRRADGDSQRFVGRVSDAIMLDTAIRDEHISDIADPGNVDLRVGGVPLILPPRRRSWPGITITTQDEVITLPTLLAEC